MAGRQRTTFAKLQKERARQEKQAAKRARRQGIEPAPTIEYAPTADLNDPSTWKYADEIEAEKKAAVERAAAAEPDSATPASGAAE
jgi:hypothetical protein